MTVRFAKRYKEVPDVKSTGATYTPPRFAQYVVERMTEHLRATDSTVRLLDPAIGDGQLVLSLLERIDGPVSVHGYDTDAIALDQAHARIAARFPDVELNLTHGSFLDHVLDDFSGGLFGSARPYDLIIANPPYVRTQIMGSERAQELAARFRLTGRVDLYHAFLIGMAGVLAPTGTAGFIVSNRFMTTKGGASTREALLTELRMREVVDLGDTKLFDAAVLPAVLIANGLGTRKGTPTFASIYEAFATGGREVATALDALDTDGLARTPDGRVFEVQHGRLDTGGTNDGVWRLASDRVEAWLDAVQARTWATFGDIGKIRVGVKTCADKVFIPKRWDCDLELHRALTTHHIAERFRCARPSRKILYPHESVDGRKRAVDLDRYPASRAYLEGHRATLEKRTYVLEAGRRWYECWVPQNPADWDKPKLVFRDISERPTFWMDLEGTIVNGDCYWMIGDEDHLWLALAVANSTFIERFYDRRFNNKLYAGRRRFITQYVSHFPLPDPSSPEALQIIDACKALYEGADSPCAAGREKALDAMVWDAFGLPIEEIPRERDL